MRSRRVLLLAFAGFIVLGMSPASFSVAWPSVAADLHRDVAELGVAVFAHILGYFIPSAFYGLLAQRLRGVGSTLVLAAVSATLGLTVWATAQSWPFLLVGSFLLGIGGGAIDVGTNVHVAVAQDVRSMGFLHASYGVGATLGPALTTFVLFQGSSWRWTFWILAAAQLLTLSGYAMTRSAWEGSPPAGLTRPSRTEMRELLPVLLVFFLYVGVEIGAGQWAFTLLTEHRGMSETVGGLLVTAYWGTFTVGRFMLGLVGHRLSRRHLLLGSVTSTAFGFGLLWWSPLPWLGAAGLVLAGFAQAPVFPLMVLETAQQVGRERAAAAIGYQLAAAVVGTVAIPAGLTPVVSVWGLGVIAPVLFGASTVLTVVMFRLLAPGRTVPQIQG